MPTTAEQGNWVKRVLGVDLSTTGPKMTKPTGTTGATIPVVRVWSDAKDQVDRQLNALYDVLRQTGIPVLTEVAGQIESVLENYRVGLISALMEYDGAGGAVKEKARIAALSTVNQYQTRLANDAHVTAADTNPFGVAVTVRTTLGAALTALQGRLSAV
jgi:hypothetical protein